MDHVSLRGETEPKSMIGYLSDQETSAWALMNEQSNLERGHVFNATPSLRISVLYM